MPERYGNEDEILEIILCMCTDSSLAGNSVPDGFFDGYADYFVVEYPVSADNGYDLCERSTVPRMGHVGGAANPVGLLDVNGLVLYGVEQCGLGYDGSYPGRQF